MAMAKDTKEKWTIWDWNQPIIKPASFVVLGKGACGKTTWINKYFTSRSYPNIQPFVYIDGLKMEPNDFARHPLILACMYKGGESQTVVEINRITAMEMGQLLTSDYLVILLSDFVEGLKGKDAKLWQELNEGRFNNKIPSCEHMRSFSSHLFIISEQVLGGENKLYVSADALTA